MTTTLAARMRIAQAAALLGIPASTLYHRVQHGTDGLNGRRHGAVTVQTKAVLAECGMTRAEAEAWLTTTTEEAACPAT